MLGITTNNINKNKEMKLMYFSVFLMGFAESMIAIFVPVYLYRLNYPLWLIVIFYFLVSLCFVILSLLGARLVSKMGIKHSIFVSTIFLISYYLLLNCLGSSKIIFYILPILMAIKMIFYNYGYHLNFLLHSQKSKRGQELSVLGIANTLSGAIGPLVAGVILVVFNFGVLFSAGTGLLIIGALALFLGKENYEPVEISISKTLNYIKNKDNWRNFTSFMGYAIESSINREIWPIYLIILLVSYDKMGLIVTLSFIVSILAYYLIGNLSDKYNKRKLLKVMTGLYFLGWLSRIFVNSGAKILVVDSYRNLTEKILHIPWEASMYDLAAREKFYLFIVVREIMFNLARIIIMPLVALVFYINFHPFFISIILASLFSLLYPTLRKAE